MKNKVQKICIALLILLFFFANEISINAFVTEDGKQASLVRIDRVISSSQSLVGKEETITYNLTGDTIIYDPPKDIALVVDVSGSMDNDLNDNSTSVTANKKISMLKAAVRNFVAKWKDRDVNICIVPFSYYVSTTPTLISMKDADCLTKLQTKIDALTPTGNTNIGDGMRVAYRTLLSSPNTDAMKYIVTLTDGQPNEFSITSKNPLNTAYYTGSGIIASNRYMGDSGSQTGLKYVTNSIGPMVLGDAKFKSYMIGFATGSSMTTNLNSMCTSMGITKKQPSGNYFYSAASQTELNLTYSDISQAIANDVPFTSAAFTDILPEGVEIPAQMMDELSADGFTINENYVVNGIARTLISKSLSGILSLARKYPQATTSPQDHVYQLKPLSYKVKIIYTTSGVKIFEKLDVTVNYDDPFYNNIHYVAKGESDFTVNVDQPVTAINVSNTVVFAGQSGGINANVLPNSFPQVAKNRNIKAWKVVKELNLLGGTTALNVIGDISSNDVTDSLNSTCKINGVLPGIIYIQAETEGTDLDGNTMKNSTDMGVVSVIDATLDNITIRLGDSVHIVRHDLIPNSAKTKTLVYSNWRSEDTNVVSVDSSGRVTGKRLTGLPVNSVEIPVRILVDATYNESLPDGSILNITKTISCLVNVAQPVTGIKLEDTILIAGSPAILTAEVSPDDAYDRSVKNWSIISAKDVNGINKSVALLMDSSPVVNPVTGISNSLIVNPKSPGIVVLRAESNGTDNDTPTPNTKITSPDANIYIIDSDCKPITIPIWGTGNIILNSYIPSGLNGNIKIISVTSENNNIAVTQYNSASKKYTIKGKMVGTVQMNVKIQYCFEDNSPSGLEKSLKCTVTVKKASVDIN